jgi:hypothetical protein
LGSVLQQADAGPVPVPLFLLVSIALRANYHLDDLPDREDPDKSKRISARLIGITSSGWKCVRARKAAALSQWTQAS